MRLVAAGLAKQAERRGRPAADAVASGQARRRGADLARPWAGGRAARQHQPARGACWRRNCAARRAIRACRSRSSPSGARDATSSSRTRQTLIAEFTNLGDQPSQADVRAIARAVTDAYINGEVDRVLLVYPKFVSTVAQTPTVIQLLPVQPPDSRRTTGG